MRADTRLNLSKPDDTGQIPIVSIHPQAHAGAQVGYIVARVCYATTEGDIGGKQPTADTIEFARLFAAAPDMRRALAQIIGWIDAGCDPSKAAIATARAALDKANGL